jgi:hypothetical protein
MKTMFVAVASVACLLLAASCYAADLSRPEAKKVLDKIGATSSATQVSFSSQQMQRIGTLNDDVKRKYFNVDTAKRCLPDSSDVRIMTGQFVQCLDLVNPSEITWQNPGVLATVRIPIQWTIIEITGIAEGQNPNVEKTVEYTWQFDFSSYSRDVQNAIKPALNPGKALFRLYDDGWRFVEFQ